MATDSKREDNRFDDATDAASTTCPISTPPTTAAHPEYLWNGPGSVPYPEHTFQIFQKDSGKSIAIAGDKAKLDRLGFFNSSDTHWLCVKQDGYFGFQHTETGVYLGHDGQSGIRASAPHLKQWELWTPREHPAGGYELLSPCGGSSLMVLCVDRDGSTLVRRRHGTTLWEFVKV